TPAPGLASPLTDAAWPRLESSTEVCRGDDPGEPPVVEHEAPVDARLRQLREGVDRGGVRSQLRHAVERDHAVANAAGVPGRAGNRRETPEREQADDLSVLQHRIGRV